MQLVDLLAEAGPDAVIDIDNALCRESLQVIGAPPVLQATPLHCSTHYCACKCLCTVGPYQCALSTLHYMSPLRVARSPVPQLRGTWWDRYSDKSGCI